MTFLEELIAAGRGIIALLLGRRNAPSHFNLTPGGLAGSLAAMLVAAALGAYLPLAGAEASDAIIHPWQNLLFAAVVYALQVGAAAMVLNQNRRLDGLVPYLVADNWANFFASILALLLAFSNLDSAVGWIVFAVFAIVIEINIARLIVTLPPLQVVIFLVAQFVAGLAGLLMMAVIFPPPLPVQ